jgi:uncharacterized protein (DUF302 family)
VIFLLREKTRKTKIGTQTGGADDLPSLDDSREKLRRCSCCDERSSQTAHFNVLSEINMKDNLKKGLDVEFRPYLILGACNPELTYRALKAEDKLGVLLPCNVIVQRQENGNVEVSAVDPVLSMEAIDHVVVGQVAQDIRSHLRQVINELRRQ